MAAVTAINEAFPEAMSEAPRRIFGLGEGLLPGAKADLAVIDTVHPFSIDSRQFLSMGKATPFDGWNVYGKIILTLMDGITVYKDN